MMKLYSFYTSSAAFRVRIVLNLKGVPHEIVPVHLLRGGGEQKSSAYLKRNPQGLVPTLETERGALAQSLAMVEYLDEVYPLPPLLPKDPFRKAEIRAVAYHIACDIHPLNNLRMRQYLASPLGHSEKEVLAWYHHWITLGFTAIEAQVKDNPGPYLFGDAPSLADVCLVPQMWNAKRYGVPLGPYPRLVAATEAACGIEAFAAAAPERQPDYEPPK